MGLQVVQVPLPGTAVAHGGQLEVSAGAQFVGGGEQGHDQPVGGEGGQIGAFLLLLLDQLVEEGEGAAAVAEAEPGLGTAHPGCEEFVDKLRKEGLHRLELTDGGAVLLVAEQDIADAELRLRRQGRKAAVLADDLPVAGDKGFRALAA
ncbi:MAG: hypothetical protein BWY77_01746 [bacterium ADurb.Bin431]|nr:MAG: hypothetical protein BWY77_01746 [bacterium ADurb.Bin431]